MYTAQTYFITCPECNGTRFDGRTVCWKCNGEGGFEVPDLPVKIPQSKIQRACVRMIIFLVVFLGIIAVLVSRP